MRTKIMLVALIVGIFVVAAIIIQLPGPATTNGPDPATTNGPDPDYATTSTPANYTVVASTVYLRSQDGTRIGYLYQNATIKCSLDQAGWCHLGDSGIAVWAGCLKPNPQQKGCETK